MRTLPAEAVGEAHGPNARIEQSWARVRALYTFLYPEDERLRNEAIATMASNVMGRYQAAPETLIKAGLASNGFSFDELKRIYGEDVDGVSQFINDVAGQTLSSTMRGLFMPHGGFASVAHAKGVEAITQSAITQFQELAFAGMILITIRQMDLHPSSQVRGGASFNKALFLLERFDHGLTCRPKSESKMRDIWKKFKNVAHVGAAILKICETRNDANEDASVIVQSMDAVYAIAKLYQEFGLCFCSGNTGSPTPILNPETLWHVPSSTLAVDFNEAALPVSAQAILFSYKAPKMIV